jgi:hypothetical protein
MNRRQVGRTVAALAALVAFSWAAWAASDSAMPEYHLYDGYWMIIWATAAVILVSPLIWRWPRDRSLAVIALAAAVGCVAPLVVSAVRHHLPVMARLRGSWILAGADLVGPAVVVGFACLWLALREGTPKAALKKAYERGKPDEQRGPKDVSE